ARMLKRAERLWDHGNNQSSKSFDRKAVTEATRSRHSLTHSIYEKHCFINFRARRRVGAYHQQ
ncbi:MAG: hypothetical protein P8J33_15360, partial [Pirellulaceae bacterium]|nr:hypothetical protein [Pirellulaceae bacterium]